MKLFIGSINPDTRILIQSLIPEFEGLPVYVGCSGNFTVERLLASKGVTNITSNDVSLYSSAVGNYVMNRKMRIGIKDKEFEWLDEYLKDGLSQIATLLLCTEYFKFVDKEQPYYKRQAAAYRNQFAKLHEKTSMRLKTRLSEVRLKDYVCGDVLNYIQMIPEESVFIAFPPPNDGGYERLYRKIDEVFDWDNPSYEMFDEEGWRTLKEEAKKKRKWLFIRDRIDDWYPLQSEFLIAEFQPASMSKTIFVYSNMKKRCLITKPQKIFEPVLIERLTGGLTGNLKLVRLKVEQLNTLRSEYMSRAITYPAIADVVIGICDDNRLLGVLAFKIPSKYYKTLADGFMIADFCVGPSIYKRLSKLVLCVALTAEVKEILEAEFQYPVHRIFTTVFTEKAVSMKYRGLFELFNKKEDGSALNYVAAAGRWTLKEAFEFWKEKYGDC